MAFSAGYTRILNAFLEPAFQKGKKTFAFEVEATADVGEDAVVRIGSLEVCDLALQVLFLAGKYFIL